MVQKVRIRKGKKTIRVHFMWNDDLVDMMRDHNGWWKKSGRYWQFPIWKFDAIYGELKKNLYSVEISQMKVDRYGREY